MPYLPEPQRQQVHRRGFALDGAELNYILTYHINKFLDKRLEERQAKGDALRYADYAAAAAAITGAEGEFRRLKMEPYEDQKRKENGEV